MATESIDWLVNQSRNHPLLTAEQEIILARQIQAWLPLRGKTLLTREERATVRRGKRAYDAFFAANIRLVVTIANRYRRIVTTMAIEDTVQEGMLGLERAIVKYDPSRGYKFSTYAFSWVRQSIGRAIANQDRMIRVPLHGTVLIKQAMDWSKEYRREHGRAPTLEQIATGISVSLEQLRLYMQHNATVMSLDAPVRTEATDSPSTYLELITDAPAEDAFSDSFDSERLDEALATLTERELFILRERYAPSTSTLRQATTYAAIGERLGVSRERVRQEHDRTIRRLRLRLTHGPRALSDTPAQLCAA